jgi:hypothetical protein
MVEIKTKDIRLPLFSYFNRTLYFFAAELNTTSSQKKRKISTGYKKRQERQPRKPSLARKRTRTPDLPIAPKDLRSSIAFTAPPPELHTISWSPASTSSSRRSALFQTYHHLAVLKDWILLWSTRVAEWSTFSDWFIRLPCPRSIAKRQ